MRKQGIEGWWVGGLPWLRNLEHWQHPGGVWGLLGRRHRGQRRASMGTVSHVSDGGAHPGAPRPGGMGRAGWRHGSFMRSWPTQWMSHLLPLHFSGDWHCQGRCSWLHSLKEVPAPQRRQPDPDCPGGSDAGSQWLGFQPTSGLSSCPVYLTRVRARIVFLSEPSSPAWVGDPVLGL